VATRNSPTVEPAEREFVISRVFDAPRELVWKAWTEAPRLAQWWGPKGCTIRVVKLDVRPGGIFHYAMQYKPGHDMWGRFIYREIAARTWAQVQAERGKTSRQPPRIVIEE